MTEANQVQIRQLVEGLSNSERLELIEWLANRVRSDAAFKRKPRDLRGIWGKVPENFDLEKELREIRNQ